MYWMINLMFAVLFTGITGTVLTVAWKLFSVYWRKSADLKASYRALQMVMVLWLLPVVYISLHLFDRLRSTWSGNLFWGTPVLRLVSKGFVVAWLIGCGALLAYDGLCRLRVARLCRATIPCDEKTEFLLWKMTKEIKGVSRVRLAQSYHVSVPCVTGMFRPFILLPMQEYSEEELQKIFRHELTHVRNGDLVMKNLAIFVRAFHFMNPLAWRLMYKYDELSECACDFDVCRTVQEIREYYYFILQQAKALTAYRTLMIGIGGEKNQLMKRMETVIRCRTGRKRPAMVAVVMAAVMLFCGVTSVYAASVKSADFLAYVNEETEVEAEQESYSWSRDEVADVSVNNGKMSVGESEIVPFEWSIAPNGYVASASFTVKKGQHIDVEVYDDELIYDDDGLVYDDDGNVVYYDDVDNGDEYKTIFRFIRVGVICPDGSKIYAIDDDCFPKILSADTEGTYRVYIQNLSSETEISVAGYYYIWDEE